MVNRYTEGPRVGEEIVEYPKMLYSPAGDTKVVSGDEEEKEAAKNGFHPRKRGAAKPADAPANEPIKPEPPEKPKEPASTKVTKQ